MKKKSPTLFIVFFLSYSAIVAQTETALVGYKITQVKGPAKGKYTLRIEHGRDVGIHTDLQVEVWGTERKDTPNHLGKLGLATITEAGDKHLIAECECAQKVLPGDLLYINSELPATSYRSPYYYLVIYGIEITDAGGKPFFTFDDILKRDGHSLQTEKFLEMQAYLQAHAQSLKAKGDTRKIKHGPAKGLLVAEVLTDSDTLEIWRYLYYRSMNYMQTMGQTYKLADDFTAYVEDGDWITPDQLWDKVIAMDLENLETLYAQYPRRITGDQVFNWVEKARDPARDGNYEQGAELLKYVARLAKLTGYALALGEVNYLQAALFYIQSDYSSAIPFYEEAAAHYGQAKDFAKQGNAYYYLGLCNNQMRNYAAAAKHYEQSVAIKEQILKTSPDDATFLQELYNPVLAFAELHSSQGRYEESLTAYRRALELAIKLNNTANRASALWNIGYLLEETRKSQDESLAAYADAAELYLQLSDSASVIELMRNQGLIHNARKHYQKSFETGNQALELARNWGKHYYVGLIELFLGGAHDEKGDKDKALAYYLAAEKSFTAANHPVKLSEAKKKVAALYVTQQLYQKALKKHEERLPVVKDNLAKKADVLWDIAYLMGDNLSQHNKAVEKYIQVAELYVELKDTVNLNVILANIAHHYRNLNDSANAYRAHERALHLTANHSNSTELAYAHEKAAKSYGHFKNFRKEKFHYGQALAIFTQRGEIAKAARVTEAMASSLSSAGKFADAADAFRKAIALYHEANDKANEAETYWDLAYMLGNSQNEYEKAINLYHTAYGIYMQIPDSVNASVMLSNIGQNYWSLFKYDNAIEYHRKAIDLASRSRNVKQVAKSWSKLATLYSESNNPVASFEALKNSLAALETVNDSTEL
ncbi:MAG TPA: tetratricopeptide repeat protein, partial [Chryseosolibacter sp.]|nr:tetratricopeptide repeat protein [Chryseosolibacter sp.]